MEARARALAREGESFSATVTRLIEAGARSVAETPRAPSWIGTGDGPNDLGRRAEHYLREIVRSR